MGIGISGYQWIDLSKTNPAPDFFFRKRNENREQNETTNK